MARKYEFFSWQGFTVGAIVMALSLIVQSFISFDAIWAERALSYVLYIAFSSIVVGITSGGVLIYLYPPDQDVIGIAGLGSDDMTQHLSLVLVILALVQPVFTGFVFFKPLEAHRMSFGLPGLIDQGFADELLRRYRITGEDQAREELTVIREIERRGSWIFGYEDKTTFFLQSDCAKKIQQWLKPKPLSFRGMVPMLATQCFNGRQKGSSSDTLS